MLSLPPPRLLRRSPASVPYSFASAVEAKPAERPAGWPAEKRSDRAARCQTTRATCGTSQVAEVAATEDWRY